MGAPARERPIRVDVIDIVRVIDDWLVDHWGGWPTASASLSRSGSFPPDRA